MKRINLLLAIFLFAGFSLLVSCDKSSDDENGNNGSTKFLIGCVGNTNNGLKAGLYTLSLEKNASAPKFVTAYHPRAYSFALMDYNNGRVAFSVDRSLITAGQSGIAYMDTTNLSDILFAPIPDAPDGYYHSVPDEQPRVLPNGNIVYRVVLNTDNAYDDAHCGMLAIYNPTSGDVELSGDPTAFVLAQREKGGDTEAGSLGEYFALSPDGRYAYCTVYGFGTDAGVYHTDYQFIVKYTIGTPGSYSRIAQSFDIPTTVTGNGKYLVLTGDGLTKIDLNTLKMTKVDDYANQFNAGQVSGSSNRMLKIWRGSGLGEFDLNDDSFIFIIDGSKISNSSYNGLGHGAQYNSNEDKIFFTGSSDFYTNYRTDLVIFSTPIKEENETPDSLTSVSAEYCTGIFLLLNE